MSFLIYDDEHKPGNSFSGIPFDKINSVKCCETHFSNFMYLTFIANNEDASYIERAQAEKELRICRRKLEFWEKQSKRQGRYQAVLEQYMKIKKEWRPSGDAKGKRNDKK
jgi:hypothetical protein